MNKSEHPKLGDAPVMMGDLLTAEHPDWPERPELLDDEGRPRRFTFAVESLCWDSTTRPEAHAQPGLPAGEPFGWTVVGTFIDSPYPNDDIETPLAECERAHVPPAWGTEHTITVGRLRELLANYPDGYGVVISKDSEGNVFSPFSSADSGDYEPECTWSGDYRETDLPGGNAVCLWPVN